MHFSVFEGYQCTGAWIIYEWIGNSTRHSVQMRLLAILIGVASD